MHPQKLPCPRVHHAGQRIAHPVHKQLLAGFPLLDHHHFLAGPLSPFLISPAKLAVSQTSRLTLPVFLPYVSQIHPPICRQPGMSVLPCRVRLHIHRSLRRIYTLSDRLIRHLRRLRVSQSRLPAPALYFSYRRFRAFYARRDCSLGISLLPEPQYFHDLHWFFAPHFLTLTTVSQYQILVFLPLLCKDESCGVGSIYPISR